MQKKDYSKLEKDDLLKVIEKLESRKKYGLIWDEEKTKERFEKESENALPVLKEVKGKEIKTDPAKPTNILIEGDNYHALSVLNYTHQGKIDVIYIDPPYNTGGEKEWKFNDKWVDKNDSYRHSKWLSFVSKRLRLGKQLLKEEGVILISIDDNEYAQLKLLSDNLFGEKQFIGSLVWEKKKKGSHLDGAITNVKEYILAYSKNADFFGGLIGEVNKEKETYPCLNPGNGYSTRIIPSGTKSTYKQSDVSLPRGNVISAGNMKLTLLSDLNIKEKRLKGDVTIEAEWRYDQNSINEFAQKDELYFTQDLYLRRIVTAPRYKKLKDLLLRTSNTALEEYLRELIELYKVEEPNKEKIISLLKNIQSLEESDYNTEINPNNLYTDGWGSNEDGDNEQRDFFGKKVFDYPKPSRLIEKLIAATGISAGIVLDFFAGSGTTAHAVMKLNKKEKNIQYILCTNNEDNNGTGLRIATDICYPRVKKVIEGFIDRNNNNVEGLGGNLKYYKTAFVKNSINRDNLKIRITRECTEMLCLREGIFDEKKAKDEYHIFEQNGKVMAIYYALERDGLEQLKKELDKMKGEKILYCFTLDPLGLNKNDFVDWQGVSLEPIPQKILDIYEQIYEY
jgi:adenine-specific DNA-methyltransferase